MVIVALYTSAWIEMPNTHRIKHAVGVALYTSAWIEIDYEDLLINRRDRRTLHECVD